MWLGFQADRGTLFLPSRESNRLMSDTLGWLRQHSPPFDWNLKGDPQGITTLKLFAHPKPPFDSLEALVLSLR